METHVQSDRKKLRDIIIVLGKTGYGKSTWTWEYLKSQTRIFAYDPLHEAPNMVWMNAAELIAWHDSFPVDARMRPERHRIATSDDESLDTFGYVAFLRGDCTFAVEEASLVFEQGERISGWAKDIVFVGRHRNVSLLVTAQRAASIPIALRSQASRVVSFAQQEGDDLNWLKGAFGKEGVAQLPVLPPLECLDSHHGKLKRYSIK